MGIVSIDVTEFPEDSEHPENSENPDDSESLEDAEVAQDQPELPLDSDIEVDESTLGRPLPVHFRPIFLFAVFVGGTVGTAAREAISLAWPAISGVPVAILTVNIAGALLLGVLLESLARRGEDRGLRRMLRLLFGTGMMGGFTTYSALAVDSVLLIGDGRAWVGVAYGLGTVLVGAAATVLGIWIGALINRPQDNRSQDNRSQDNRPQTNQPQIGSPS